MRNTKRLGLCANILALASVVLLVIALLVPGVLVEEMCSHHTDGCRQEYSSWLDIFVHAGPVGIGFLALLVLWLVVAVPGIVFWWWQSLWAVAVLGLVVLLTLSCVMLILQGHDAGVLSMLIVLGCGLAVFGAALHVWRDALQRRTAASRNCTERRVDAC